MQVPERHIPELDGLRGIAILSVFIFHTYGFLDVKGVPRWLIRLAAQGWTGVDLFFVLSGFLITGILLDTRESAHYFRNFYVRRFLRIFPLYYSVLTGVILVTTTVECRECQPFLPTAHQYPFYYAYLTNFLAFSKAPPQENWLWHFWTLAIEEQFYILWPLCIWIIPRRRLKWVAIFVSIAALALRLAWVHLSGPFLGIAVATPARVDTLLVGALCAVVYRESKMLNTLRRWLFPAASLCLGVFLFFAFVLTKPDEYYSFVLTVAYTLLAIGFGSVVLLVVSNADEQNPVRRLLRSRGLMRAGKYSYGMYVFHPIIIGPSLHFLSPYLANTPSLYAGIIFVGATFVATVAVSALSYEMVEARILRLKRYFAPGFERAGVPQVRDVLCR
jgi:peptidoglycan/LPS O-acetylase OafA/YrhL